MHQLRTIYIIFILLAFMKVNAQESGSFEQYNTRRQERFNKFREQKIKDFEEFRRKRNEEFAKYMRKDWERIDPSPVIPRPKEEPVPPVVAPIDGEKPVDPKPLPFDEVVPIPDPEPQPKPVDPIEEVPITPTDPPVSYIQFTFYGTEEQVRFDKNSTFHLSNINEYAIADAWLKLSETSYTNLIYDCLQIRQSRNLCDWAYLKMLEQMSESVYGKGTNESVLLMAYVYCQSGYKMRLATDGAKLYMMFASNHVIYNWNYYKLDGQDYYVFNNQTCNVRICNQQYPKEQSMSLTIPRNQKLDYTAVSGTAHKSKRYPEIDFTVDANKNMLEFYSSYPTSMYGDNFVTRWALYANMPMPDNVADRLYPKLRRIISGKSQLDAVNCILNWIQTGFVYEYDDKVWGQDRAFFPEESLYYPYCDCEDRSILFTRVIRDVLSLKCILIYYPGHLAAGVELTEAHNVGDYIECKGHRYYISDGTIIGNGAPVGQTMNGMNNQTAKIVILE